MAEPKTTFYYDGELPAHVSFFDASGNEESFELAPTFDLTDPGHIAIALNLVQNPFHHLSLDAPAKKEK